MFHNILYPALENITQTIYGVHFHIAIVPQSIDLRTVDIIMGVQIILGNTTQLHGFPQAVVFDHNAATPHFFLILFYYPSKMNNRIVFT